MVCFCQFYPFRHSYFWPSINPLPPHLLLFINSDSLQQLRSLLLLFLVILLFDLDSCMLLVFPPFDWGLCLPQICRRFCFQIMFQFCCVLTDFFASMEFRFVSPWRQGPRIVFFCTLLQLAQTFRMLCCCLSVCDCLCYAIVLLWIFSVCGRRFWFLEIGMSSCICRFCWL